jgi:hypothetical protein
MAACPLLLALAATPARASGQKYRLEVVRAEGAGSCPAAAVLEHDVIQRLGRSPFGEDGERGIEIVLERSETGFRARLYLRVDATEPDAARVIESDSADCAELGKSVALAVSLAIAPELPPLEPKPKVEAPVCPKPPTLPPPPPPPTLHGTASLRGLWSPHLLPSGSPGAALSVTLRGELLGINFGGIFYPEATLQRDGAKLGFGISAGFLSGCLWARTREPQVWSCLGARIGALHSVVYTPEPQHPGDRFWSAAAMELGLRQTLFGRAFVDAGAAAVFPLVRHRFLVDAASTPIYEQGPALVEGFVGLGLRLD